MVRDLFETGRERLLVEIITFTDAVGNNVFRV